MKGGGELQISELGYLSSKGRKLEGVDITPDKVAVATLADLRSRRDAWIDEAENFPRKHSKK